MEIRNLALANIEAIWAINEQGLPGTGRVSEQEISDLLQFSSLSVGMFDGNELLGFVICLPPRTRYGSLNYQWFNDHYNAFVYVDRIAVSTLHRNQGVGTKLYETVVAYSKEKNIPIAAEVNLNPPNPGSIRFHERFHFEQVGVLHHKEKSVTMLLRKERQ
ncbi:MAG: GNAT family N-acetyltransferase [Candidatus Poseidoniaceae archaeon]|nr:GNAT family N-acetyltransferase [Candidatus Poseidoniaceae archaeon]